MKYFFTEPHGSVRRPYRLLLPIPKEFLMHVSRIYLLIMVSALWAYASPGNGQTIEDTHITVEFKRESLKNVFDEIEKQSGFFFLSSPEEVSGYTDISLPKGTYPVSDVLSMVLEDTDLKFIGKGKYVMVYKEEDEEKVEERLEEIVGGEEEAVKPELAEEEVIMPLVITGTVYDSKQMPLPGVNIIVKGTTKGTTTDAEGKFVIEVAKDDDVLVFTFVGLATFETQVNGRTIIDVTMEDDATKLSEVVVSTGYWQTKKRENVGNISRVDSKAIDQPVINPLQSLVGRVPGLQIDQTSGDPGGEFRIRIRGQNSVRQSNAANDPLIVVDGVPYPTESLNGIPGANISPSPINMLNPNDIDHIEVLKDADATAIYGSLGANGVILITTKKGASGRTVFDVNVSHGVGKITKKADLLNTEQYIQMRREAFKNDGTTPRPGLFGDVDLLLWDTTRYTDWQETLIGGTAYQTKAQLSISGGNEKTQFYLSGGYIKETTVYPDPLPYQRGSLHFTGSHTSSDSRFHISLSSDVAKSKSTLPSGSFALDALNLPPNAPYPVDEDGNLTWGADGFPLINPYSRRLTLREGITTNMINTLGLSYQLIPHLQLKSNIGYNVVRDDVTSIIPISSANPVYNFTGQYDLSNNEIRTWVAEPQLSYDKQILSDRASLSVLIGATLRETVTSRLLMSARGFANDASLKNFSAASSISIGNDNLLEYRYAAMFARIGFNWNEKYYINLTGRRDGSSRFGQDNRFANFGAIGAAWIFTREKVLLNSPLLSFGKLRFSYGTSGNDGIGDYQFLPAYAPYSIPYQGSNPILPARLGNPEYQWELTRKMEFGLEFGLLNDRIYSTVSYYKNRSSNQLVQIPLPDATGFSGITDNLDAIVENTGWEFELNTVAVKSEHFKWTAVLNASLPRNELVKFPNLNTSGFADSYIVGEPLTVVKVFESTGVDTETGVYTFKDVDEDGSISSPNDMQKAVNFSPKFEGGILNSLTYKGIQIDFFFQVRKIVQRSFETAFVPPGYSSFGTKGNQATAVLARWQNEGEIVGTQKFSTIFIARTAHYNYTQSDAAFVDASFIRLKNISISYSLPISLIQKWRFQNVRLYVQAQNLFVITNYKVLDPESGTTLPPLKLISTGLQLTF